MAVFQTRYGLAALLALCSHVAAESGQGDPAGVDSLQQEADYRVVAARCGSPAFESSFMRQSRAMVAKGLIGWAQDAAGAEKSITSLRRNPSSLVATSADCRAELLTLEALKKDRSRLVKGGVRR